jgi:AcrR family transcriptional regulator
MAKRQATPKGEARSTAPRDKVYEVAARVFHSKGYDNTSMNDIAEAVGLTKAGLYHHVTSKESLLATILEDGLDLTETFVVEPLAAIADPMVRLRKLIELHLKLILEGRKLAVTGLLHECQGLAAGDRARINRRKKQYVRTVTRVVQDVIESCPDRPAAAKDLAGRDFEEPMDPKVAALALLGMLNWTYQWYKPSGSVEPEKLVAEFQSLFIHGILGTRAERPGLEGV